MNCKSIQELILTDYADARLSKTKLAAVQAHVQHCPHCRALAQKVQRTAIDPFQGTPAASPDPFVWLRIKNRLNEESRVQDVRVGMLDIFSNFAYSFRPAAVLACALCVLTLGSVVSYNVMQSHQQPYLSYVMGDDTSGAEDTVSTSIERYFL